MEDIFEEYGSLIVGAVAALIVSAAVFIMFKDGSALSEWIRSYAESIGG
jgi:hypothetical protein